MLINNLNLNSLRVFEAVFRTKSMTLASRELHLTQSGVSQHIKALEEGLAVALFDRIQKKLVPTSAGDRLHLLCSQSLNDLEKLVSEFRTGSKELRGTVAIGMPIEFGNNVLMPLVGGFCQKHPGVSLKLTYDFASTMNRLLLEGRLDFAFVDDFRMDKMISTEKVYDEVLELCIARDLSKKIRTDVRGEAARAAFEALDFVDYQEGEPIVRMWFQHHFGSVPSRLRTRGTVMDVQGIARLIQAKVGAGLLPAHLLTQLKKEGRDLHVFKMPGRPFKNTISLAYLTERTQSQSAAELMSFAKTALKVG